VQAASRVGFAGGLVVDYPNSSKAKKFYLCLSFERSYKLPQALGTAGEEPGVRVVNRDTKYVPHLLGRCRCAFTGAFNLCRCCVSGGRSGAAADRR